MSLVEALAAVLSGQRAMSDLGENEAQSRYRLSREEFAALRALPPESVAMMRSQVRTSRWEFLSVLPATTRYLADLDGGRVRDCYLFTTTRPARSVGSSRWLIEEARDLADWLARQPNLPPSLCALAAFELLKLDLAEDPRASAAARSRAERVDGLSRGSGDFVPPADAVIGLSAAARAKRFDYDVITIAASTGTFEPAVSCCFTGVLLQKQWPRRLPLVVRVGMEVVDILTRCDGRRTVAEVAETTSDGSRATAAIAGLVRRGAVVLDPD